MYIIISLAQLDDVYLSVVGHYRKYDYLTKSEFRRCLSLVPPSLSPQIQNCSILSKLLPLNSSRDPTFGSSQYLDIDRFHLARFTYSYHISICFPHHFYNIHCILYNNFNMLQNLVLAALSTRKHYCFV